MARCPCGGTSRGSRQASGWWARAWSTGCPSLGDALAQLQVAFFIDTADTLAAHESLRELDLATGYGLGLVIATPLGELHGDLGWNPEGKMVPSVWLSAAF